ncbi:MAG: cupin domain-containing protein [Comamonadaceae bacterium]|jgi:mannose-6-phosphate isomerase-like protein (cupin superfamily)|uniref:cupin domain-containing protein n=1 Tax=Hydrogenophaga sp. SNF1 TaxID=3098762 RepID=UPI002ACC0E91|nr:cupin domain-containing protein [Hydrogenophaga sp. SNF1]NCT95770.1 cupin domain-containing protein [Comamonadaceae bacterium]WQB82068.1 cupin domain-containing protein [Hydrogenophaga sp. SNF1]
MSIDTVRPTHQDMQRCVARFSELSRCEEGLPDMQLPECRRAFLNVLGFEQPRGEGQFSPFGDKARAKVSHLTAGFGVSFIQAAPGKGVLMHTHDTVETFMAMKGRWKVEWEGAEGDAHVLLEPLDFIALPVGVQRRFECVEAPLGEPEGLLLGMIGGNAPAAEISPKGVQRLIEAGIYKADGTMAS